MGETQDREKEAEEAKKKNENQGAVASVPFSEL